MIRELTITDLGVIASARLELGAGLTVLTGETGAGKTLITTAISQLLGAKADSGLVRSSADEAVIEAVIDVANWPGVAAQLEELGAQLDGDECIVTRTIARSARSRTLIGGRSVSAGSLGELLGVGVTLHGQHGQTRLTRSAEQRGIVDAFGALGPQLAEYREHWATARALRNTLATLDVDVEQRAARVRSLRALVEDVEALTPREGEDIDLDARIAVLSDADELSRMARSAHAVLAGDPESDEPDAAGLLAIARRVIDGMRGDERFRAWNERLVELRENVLLLAHEIDHFATSLDDDPRSLDALLARRAAIGALVRRWGVDLDAVLREYTAACRELEGVGLDGTKRQSLEAELAVADEHSAAAALALHLARTKAAAQLAVSVQAEIRALGLQHAEFSVEVSAGAEATGFGTDVVEFRFSANPGQPVQPLAAVASGGELSRVMLALEVVAAKDLPSHTFIFDEVDAGIGGAAALEVGRRLAELARTQQVLVVTHLAQVAAFADVQIVVTKEQDALGTRTAVRSVSGDERAREIARMLGGVAESDAAAAHARELLALGSRGGSK